MLADDYLPRIVDAQLQQALEESPAVLVVGPRYCGKTTSAQQLAASTVRLDEARGEVPSPNVLRQWLDGPEPRLLDEWQTVPAVWNAVRHECDRRRGNGHFILTGSAAPSDDATRHSGAGRVRRVPMRPMTAVESGLAVPAVSIEDLMEGRGVDAYLRDAPSLDDIVEAICRGGWPARQTDSLASAMRAVRDYVDEVCRVDVRSVSGVNHNPLRAQRLLKSVARNVGTEASVSTLGKDTGTEGEPPLASETVNLILDALERTFIVERCEAWAPSLRSRARLRQTRKLYFTCPSLAVAALGASADGVKNDREYLGFLFESLVMRDLRVHAQALGAQVSHYRDGTGLEVDAVITAADDRWLAAEVKLAATPQAVDRAAASLLRLAAKVELPRPAGKLVVIVGVGGPGSRGAQQAHERPDGVAVVPFAALGPAAFGVSSEAEQPLTLLRVDVANVGSPRGDGTGGSALYSVPIVLNRPPTADEGDLLVQYWDRPPQGVSFTLRHRPGRLGVSGRGIVLHNTTIDEVAEYHQHTLAGVVQAVNRRTADIRAERLAERRRAVRAEAELDQHVRDVARRITFAGESEDASAS